MSVSDLKQRHATLEAVRVDFRTWHVGLPVGDVPHDELPVVALDWSEIFSYLTYTPPRQTNRQDLFELHYAGLHYLLFRLPCRLVLLPPYVEEMNHFVSLIKNNALLVHLTKPAELTRKYDELVTKIEALRKDVAFEAVLKGDWSAMDRLPPEAWDLVEALLREHLPSLFLDIQENTADAMQSLGALRSPGADGRMRLATLAASELVSEKACNRALAGWTHWLDEMSTQRRGLERQNRADALALAYLEALHVSLLERNVPLYFASRSSSMQQIMENHCGEFQPHHSGVAENDRRVRSSWRSWDYFAELGYYWTWRPEHDGDLLDAIEHDIRQRQSRIERGIFGKEHELQRAASSDAPPFDEWETLRGSLDLEQVSAPGHWKKKLADRREVMLADLLSAILVAPTAGAFLEKRLGLAKDILANIEQWFNLCVTPDSLLFGRRDRTEDRLGVSSVADIAVTYLNVPVLFNQYVRAGTRKPDDTVVELVELLKRLMAAKPLERALESSQLLRRLTQCIDTGALSAASMDWLTGTAAFFSGFYPETTSYLKPWLATHASAASAGLGLATRAFCADAYRQMKQSDVGMQVMLDVQPEKLDAMSASERLVWRCLTGQLLIDWVESAAEHFELFPRLSGRRSEEELIVPMLRQMIDAFDIPPTPARALQRAAANILLYLAARHIPEDAREIVAREKTVEVSKDNAETGKGRLAWFVDRQSAFSRVEDWLRNEADDDPSGRLLHTLGYFNWKMYLLDRKRAHGEKAMEYFDAAENIGSADTLLLVGRHKGWAAETLRRSQ